MGKAIIVKSLKVIKSESLKVESHKVVKSERRKVESWKGDYDKALINPEIAFDISIALFAR